MEKLGPLSNASGKVKRTQYCGKQYGGSSQNKHGITTLSSDFLLSVYPKRSESRDSTDVCTATSIAALFDSQEVDVTLVSIDG